MHILFLTDNFPPETNASASRVYERALHWVKWNHEVTIITSFPNFPNGKLHKGYSNKLYKKETINGIKVVRVFTYIAKNEGFYRRIIDFISFMPTSICFGMLIKKADVVISTSPQFFTACAGYILSVARKEPFIFELSDLWPDTIKSVKAMSNSGIYKILEAIELFLYKQARFVICLTSAFKSNLIERGIDESKLFVVKNGCNLEHFKPSKKAGDKSLIKIGYIGNHGPCQDLGHFLKIIPKLNLNRFEFLFIGDGSEKENLIAYQIAHNIKNIKFLESVDKNEIVNVWRNIDIALVHLKDDSTFSTVIPSKIFEACAMHKPILLISPLGEASELISEYNVGEHVPYNTKLNMVNTINACLDKLTKKEKYKVGFDKICADYNRETQARNFLAVMQKL